MKAGKLLIAELSPSSSEAGMSGAAVSREIHVTFVVQNESEDWQARHQIF